MRLERAVESVLWWVEVIGSLSPIAFSKAARTECGVEPAYTGRFSSVKMENKWDVIGTWVVKIWSARLWAFVVMSMMVSLTRSSIRNRDSFQAKRDRNIVLWGNKDMLSASRARIWEGLYMLLVRA